jgi:large subunit ribosomal protein L25
VLNALPVEAEATHIPESVTASVEGLTIGDSVLARDIPLPSGTTLAIDGEDVVLQVLQPQAEEPSGAEENGEASETPAV